MLNCCGDTWNIDHFQAISYPSHDSDSEAVRYSDSNVVQCNNAASQLWFGTKTSASSSWLINFQLNGSHFDFTSSFYFNVLIGQHVELTQCSIQMTEYTFKLTIKREKHTQKKNKTVGNNLMSWNLSTINVLTHLNGMVSYTCNLKSKRLWIESDLTKRKAIWLTLHFIAQEMICEFSGDTERTPFESSKFLSTDQIECYNWKWSHDYIKNKSCTTN